MKQYTFILILLFFVGCSDTALKASNSFEATLPLDTISATVASLPFQSLDTNIIHPAWRYSLDDITQGALFGCGGIDCIPQYTDPDLIDAKDSYISDSTLVVGVYLNGASRAYPLSTLWHHEIANDTLGGAYIAVNYCPLTGTALNFNAFRNNVRTQFLVSGQLFNNNLILYDTESKSWWPQMLFTSMSGPSKGQSLSLLPVYEMTWGSWVALNPTTTLVSQEFQSSRYPYGDYYTNNSNILFNQYIDDRLGNKDLVYGVIGSKSITVYPFDSLGYSRVVLDTIDSQPVLIIYNQSSQGAAAYMVPDSSEVGFSLGIDSLSIINTQGESWDFLGRNNGQGADLIPISSAFKGFWLSWSAYYNDVTIWQGI